MAKQSAGNTALGAAVCRLIEQYQPQETRLFNDPVVKNLVSAPIRFLMKFAIMRNFTITQTDATMQGIYGTQVCRTRYDDDAIRAALSQGIDQVVILGAGLDTRPYRLSEMSKTKVFEIDLPAVQNNKKKKLQEFLGHLPENITYIPIDFATQTLESALDRSSFDPSKPAMFVWEGVTQYLSEKNVQRTLSFVGKSAQGSIIVFTYVLKSIIERRSNIPGAEKMLNWMAENNAAWLFGLEPSSIQAYLQPFHLTLIENVGNANYQERYLKPLQRHLIVTEGERIAQAVVARS